MAACVSSCVEGIVEAFNTRVYGNGTQTLVLSHGFGSNQGVWHFLVPFLAIYFKVVVFDLVFSANVNPELYDPVRYSNYSAYAQDVICILDQLHVKKTIFLGHSMSAMLGCIASIKRPDLFKHLILLNGSPRYLNAKGYHGGYNISEVNSTFSSIESNFSGWVQEFVQDAIIVNNSEAISELENSFGTMQPWIALSAAKTVYLSDYRFVLPYVQIPCSIIQSKVDIVVPNSVAFYMKNKLKVPAKVIILRATGHYPQLTASRLLLCVLKKVFHYAIGNY